LLPARKAYRPEGGALRLKSVSLEEFRLCRLRDLRIRFEIGNRKQTCGLQRAESNRRWKKEFGIRKMKKGAIRNFENTENSEYNKLDDMVRF
jgi:hypothetical protein